MKFLLAFLGIFILSLHTASATVCYSISSSGNVITISAVPNSNYTVAPNNIWTTFEVTVSWPSSLGTTVIQSFAGQNGFPFLKDGPIFTVGSVNYQKYGFSGAAVGYSMNSGVAASVLQLTVSHTTIAMGDFSISQTPPAAVGNGQASITNVFGDEFASGGCNLVAVNVLLPIELLSFTATPTATTIDLAWSALNEVNSANYELQRSTNGLDFVGKHTVKAKNAGEFKANYAHVDSEVEKAVRYFYRLKIVDTDGSFSFSPIRSAMLAGKNSRVLVSPNPAAQFLTIEYSSDGEHTVQVQIMDTAGRLVRQNTFYSQKGANKFSINRLDLPAGPYAVHVLDGNQRYTELLIVD